MAKLPDPDTLDWGAMDKHTFKRTELAYELAHEKDGLTKVNRQTLIAIPTREALAFAQCIYRVKGYTKTGDAIANIYANQGTSYSNKEMILYALVPSKRPSASYILEFYPTEDDYETADAIIKHYRRLSFGILADDINDYQQKVFSITQSDQVTNKDLGILASIPSTYEREISSKEARQQIKETNQTYIGKVGENVILTVRYIKTQYVKNLGCFAHQAVTEDTNQLVSFLNKIELGQKDVVQKIKGKVKKHGNDFVTKSVETQLNYVKVLETL